MVVSPIPSHPSGNPVIRSVTSVTESHFSYSQMPACRFPLPGLSRNNPRVSCARRQWAGLPLFISRMSGAALDGEIAHAGRGEKDCGAGSMSSAVSSASRSAIYARRRHRVGQTSRRYFEHPIVLCACPENAIKLGVCLSEWSDRDAVSGDSNSVLSTS